MPAKEPAEEAQMTSILDIHPTRQRGGYRYGWSSGRLWPTARLLSLLVMSGVTHGASGDVPATPGV